MYFKPLRFSRTLTLGADYASPVTCYRHRTSRVERLLRWVAVALILGALGMLVGCGGGGSAAPVANPGAPEPYVIAAYGDSTQEAQGHPHAASRPGAKIYNRGVGGTNTTMLLAGTDGRNYPWPEQMARESVRIIVINHGINDGALTIEQYKANLRELVTVAQKAGKIVILEEPNPAGETMTPLMLQINFNVVAFEERRAAMKHVADHMGVYFCAQPRVTLEDGIHPDAPGRANKANRLAKCAEDIL